MRTDLHALKILDEFDVLSNMGFDAVWFMGVWERSPEGVRIGREHPGLLAELNRALPGFSPLDAVGSPYSVHRYVVDERLGGPGGLAAARERLAERGIRVILDYVPNHVAVDHPWVFEHPEYLVQGSAEDLARTPGEFFKVGERIFAYGRDPYFPPWTDVAQLNGFDSGLRQATIETLSDIAAQCDGVRCDMAMLLVNRIFAKTWGQRAGVSPAAEFWPEVIQALRAEHPEFLFMAEAYWDMESELQQQGFNYCYDKRLYDRLAHETAESVRLHLMADLVYQEKSVRFIENHDEPRAAATFGPLRSRVAALTVSTLPGARLFHQGQFEGWKVKLPVQLSRRPPEPADQDLQNFHLTLLRQISHPVFRDGEWQLCELSGWPDNDRFLNLASWCWRLGDERRLVVANLSGTRSQGRTQLPWKDLAGRVWELGDVFSGKVFERAGDEMIDPGLYVELEPWGFHLLSFE